MEQKDACEAVHLEYTEETGADAMNMEQRVQVDWTKEEEGKALRKLDLSLIPLCVLTFATLDIANGN